MSGIVAINGSPKPKDSVSGMLIDQMEAITGSPIQTYQATKLIRDTNNSGALADILTADTLLVVFPLYVDSLPAPLIKTLTLIEEALTKRREAATVSPQQTVVTTATAMVTTKVYAVCNCGFYEPEHTRLALEMLEHFSARAGLLWGFGVGIGCGGFIYSKRKHLDKRSTAKIYAALSTLGKSLQAGDQIGNLGDEAEKPNLFVTATMPRAFYNFGGNIVWRQWAREYQQEKNLLAQPH